MFYLNSGFMISIEFIVFFLFVGVVFDGFKENQLTKNN